MEFSKRCALIFCVLLFEKLLFLSYFILYVFFFIVKYLCLGILDMHLISNLILYNILHCIFYPIWPGTLKYFDFRKGARWYSAFSFLKNCCFYYILYSLFLLLFTYLSLELSPRCALIFCVLLFEKLLFYLYFILFVLLFSSRHASYIQFDLI